MTTRPSRSACSGLLALAACAGQRRPDGRGPALASVRTVAFSPSDVVVALLSDGQLWFWTGHERTARYVRFGHPVVALAADGSLMATLRRDKGQADRLQVWDLRTSTLAHAREFPEGVEAVLGLSRAGVLLSLKVPPDPGPKAEVAMLPDPEKGAVWQFDKDQVIDGGRLHRCRDLTDVAADGRHLACGWDGYDLRWGDLEHEQGASTGLARDWERDRRPEVSTDEVHTPRKPVYEFPDYDILSVRLGPSGGDVFVTYHGTGAHHGWRFERWSPAPPRGGELQRLASTDHDARTQLLAISPDGRLAILGGGGEAPTLRRAPSWAASPLAAPPATAAAFTAEGTRFVTGHADGSLRNWDAATGRLLSP
jgi:WD40 repeat protein